MSLAVRIENLGKRYRVNHAVERGEYQTLRDAIVRTATAPLRRLRHGPSGSREDFWALRDVSFDVDHGEVVGIIGRNGAGKSTLLKILSQITKPTKGCVKLYGRVASLLEVGTGFHPELTGRENIFLNGSILGMSRAEIQRKFDEIVEFSGVERFLDTPVKRYSSGMKVRLAFSVAAHLEPEILIIDEVLAVGDAEFQKKCLGKMGEIASSGRTILFVSHNMAAMQSLCTRGVVLMDGAIAADATIGSAVAFYHASLESFQHTDLRHRTDRQGNGDARLIRIRVVAKDEHAICTGQPAVFMFDVQGATVGANCIFVIIDEAGNRLARFDSSRTSVCSRHASGASAFICEIDNLWLRPGRYRVDAALRRSSELLDLIDGAGSFDIAPSIVDGLAVAASPNGYSSYLPHSWHPF